MNAPTGAYVEAFPGMLQLFCYSELKRTSKYHFGSVLAEYPAETILVLYVCFGISAKTLIAAEMASFSQKFWTNYVAFRPKLTVLGEISCFG